jgi:hypothetical protein
MSFFTCLSSSGAHLNHQTTTTSRSHVRWKWHDARTAGLAALLPLFLLLLASCSNPFASGGGPGSTPASTPSAPSLADLRWCGKPSMVFRDEGAQPSPTATASVTPTTVSGATPTATSAASSTPTTPTPTATASPTAKPGTPTTLTSWDEVQAGLPFTIFLPASLPAGTCLVSAQATIHDPILGGNFLIGYLLPDHTALTISEAPVISQNTTFQCNASTGTGQKSPTGTATPGTAHATPSPTPLPTQLCSGAKGTTNIVLSAQRSVEYLQQLFTNLQPNVTWIPAA